MKKNHVLIIEDDQILGETLVDCFELQNYSTTWARSYIEYKKLPTLSYDVALIDYSLPDGNGFDFASQFLNDKSTPFIFMTAKNEAEFRLKGFEIGAADYIPKPFHFKELLIRIEKIVNVKPQLVVNKRTVHFDSQSIKDEKGEIVPLPNKDFLVLKYLIDHAPNIITRDELLDRLWDEDKYPTPRTVDNSIVRIRKALGDNSGQQIHSIRGRGYQWIL